MSSSWSEPRPAEMSKTEGNPIQQLADLIARAMSAEARRVNLEREQELMAEQSQKARAEAIESWNAAHSILVSLLLESRPTSVATHMAHLLEGTGTGKR